MPDSPLFLIGHQTMNRNYFISTVRKLLVRTKVQNFTDYSGHSFRRGGATAARAAGLPDHAIRALGRWSSDAVLIYATINHSQLLSYGQQITSASPTLVADTTFPFWAGNPTSPPYTVI